MKRKIFVVERDEDILQILIHVLEEEGYEVIYSKTESGLVEQLIKIKPDAILLDVIQTTAHGTELCRAIKASHEIKHIPVIVLSTHVKADVVKEVCADDVLPKPFDIEKLIDIIENQLVNN